MVKQLVIKVCQFVYIATQQMNIIFQMASQLMQRNNGVHVRWNLRYPVDDAKISIVRDRVISEHFHFPNLRIMHAKIIRFHHIEKRNTSS